MSQKPRSTRGNPSLVPLTSNPENIVHSGLSEAGEPSFATADETPMAPAPELAPETTESSRNCRPSDDFALRVANRLEKLLEESTEAAQVQPSVTPPISQKRPIPNIASGTLPSLDSVKATIISVMNYQGVTRTSEFELQLHRHVPTVIRTEVETTVLDVLLVAQVRADDQFCMAVKDLVTHALKEFLTTNPNVAGL